MLFGLYPFLPLLRRGGGVHRQIDPDELSVLSGVYGIPRMGP